jgi:hypothetical protein
MTKTRNAAPKEPTEALLQQLTIANSSPAEEAAVAAPSDRIVLPAGSRKVVFLRPDRIKETRARGNLGRPVPAWLVFENRDGKFSSHEAFSFAGAEPRINLSGGLPYAWMPNYIRLSPSAAAVEALAGLELFFETDGDLTLFTEPCGYVTAERRGPLPAEVVKAEPLPEIPRVTFSAPEIHGFLEAAEEFIVAGYAEKKIGRAIAAAHALAAVAQTLAVVDTMSTPPPRKPGDQFDAYGEEDVYPNASSSVLRAGSALGSVPPQLQGGYLAAVRLCASRALDRKQRTTCEHGGEQLLTLSERLRNLTE